jgi:hypothetical protein
MALTSGVPVSGTTCGSGHANASVCGGAPQTFYAITNTTGVYHAIVANTTAGSIASSFNVCTPSTYFPTCWGSNLTGTGLSPGETFYLIVSGSCVNFTITATLM